MVFELMGQFVPLHLAAVADFTQPVPEGVFQCQDSGAVTDVIFRLALNIAGDIPLEEFLDQRQLGLTGLLLDSQILFPFLDRIK